MRGKSFCTLTVFLSFLHLLLNYLQPGFLPSSDNALVKISKDMLSAKINRHLADLVQVNAGSVCPAGFTLLIDVTWLLGLHRCFSFLLRCWSPLSICWVLLSFTFKCWSTTGLDLGPLLFSNCTYCLSDLSPRLQESLAHKSPLTMLFAVEATVTLALCPDLFSLHCSHHHPIFYYTPSLSLLFAYCLLSLLQECSSRSLGSVWLIISVVSKNVPGTEYGHSLLNKKVNMLINISYLYYINSII